MSDPPDEVMQAAFAKAIDGVIQEMERGIATRWVIAVESTNSDGVDGMWVSGSPGLLDWDMIGLTEFAALKVRTLTQRGILRDEGF